VDPVKTQLMRQCVHGYREKKQRGKEGMESAQVEHQQDAPYTCFLVLYLMVHNNPSTE
jgi:hypothetical protein